MGMREGFINEFDHETGTTRKILERVPADKVDWKPHDTSMPMGRLAGHIAEMIGFGALIFQGDSFDFMAGGAPSQPTVMTSQKQLLELFDKNAAAMREAVKNASDEDLAKTWTLLAGGKTVFSLPRIAVLRTMILNHVIHHRGQLSVYLRMNQVAIPSIYGPSGDEGKM
jgi:uncharacterized damage-inducible protein DinB